MQKPLKGQHLALCIQRFLMESASSLLNISHIRVQTHFIYWKALSKRQMLEFKILGQLPTAFENEFAEMKVKED